MSLYQKGDEVLCPHCDASIAVFKCDVNAGDKVSEGHFKFTNKVYRHGERMDCWKCGLSYFGKDYFSRFLKVKRVCGDKND